MKPDIVSIAKKRALEHAAIVERMETFISNAPDDKKLALGIGSARRRAAESLSDYEALLKSPT